MNSKLWMTVGLWGGLMGCAPVTALWGHAQVEHVARHHCEQMPSMEQRNQCLRDIDKTTPQGLRPRAPLGLTVPANEQGQDQQEQRRQALCIRREGQPPLCPN